jgi:HEAT repeat protein
MEFFMRYAVFVLSAALFVPALALAADELSKRLVSPDDTVRARAIARFERLKPQAKEAYVPDLMMAVNDENPGVRQDAQRLLKEMGVQSRKAEPDLKAKMSAERSVLTDVTPGRSPEDLRAAREKEFGDMRRQLEEEKRQLGGSEVASNSMPSPVLEALEDPDPLIRSHAARQLSTIRPMPVQAIPTLIKMLKAKDTESQVAAAAALGAMGPAAREAIPGLINLIGRSDTAVRQIAGEALKQIQPQP